MTETKAAYTVGPVEPTPTSLAMQNTRIEARIDDIINQLRAVQGDFAIVAGRFDDAVSTMTDILRMIAGARQTPLTGEIADAIHGFIRRSVAEGIHDNGQFSELPF